jgi:hypothetical protein
VTPVPGTVRGDRKDGFPTPVGFSVRQQRIADTSRILIRTRVVSERLRRPRETVCGSTVGMQAASVAGTSFVFVERTSQSVPPLERTDSALATGSPFLTAFEPAFLLRLAARFTLCGTIRNRNALHPFACAAASFFAEKNPLSAATRSGVRPVSLSCRSMPGTSRSVSLGFWS